jgi:signal transduction histidine kinase
MPLPALPDDPTHFCAILAALPGNFILLLPDAPTYTILAMSEELLRQTDRTAAQVVGQSVFVAYPANPVASAGPAQMRAALDASLHDKQPHHLPLMRYDVATATGAFEERYWSGHSQAVLNAQGEVRYLLFTSEDLTAQRRADNEQRAVQQAAESEARFQALVAQAPVAMSLTRGPEVVIEAVNEPMLRLLAQPSAAAVLGRRMVEVLPELAAQPILRIAKEVTETGQAFKGNEIPVVLRANGALQTSFFNVSYTPFIEQGQVTGLIHVAAEVTEQVLARQQVQDLNDALQQSNAELHASNQRLTRNNADLDTFIYMASHDLWNPISNIEGLLQALRHDLALPPGTAEVAELLELMQHSVTRFKRTIRDLTNIARLQQANTPFATAIDLARLIEEVRQDLAPQFAATAGTLTVEVSACPTLHFAEKNLRSIVYNLLSNGLKYRHPDRPPRLAIRCYTTANSHVLAVQDNGLGLDATQQAKVFGLFQRQHDHVEGSGVGLYMVQKIMENAGGTIEVESELGAGSTFLVYLPHQEITQG